MYSLPDDELCESITITREVVETLGNAVLTYRTEPITEIKEDTSIEIDSETEVVNTKAE